MILLIGILAGLLAGLARNAVTGGRLAPPALRLLWLVPLAYLPQWVAFQLPATSRSLSDEAAGAALVGSQALLLVFAAYNLRQPGFWMLGLGLALNLAVITLNGGLMPISPETAAQLAPDAPAHIWQIGERLGSTKDVLLPMREMKLWWLSDRFVLLGWFSYHVAFSLGDILITLGAFRFLWAISGRRDASQPVGIPQPARSSWGPARPEECD